MRMKKHREVRTRKHRDRETEECFEDIEKWLAENPKLRPWIRKHDPAWVKWLLERRKNPEWCAWFEERRKDPDFADNVRRARETLAPLAREAKELLELYESMSEEERREIDRRLAEDAKASRPQ